MRSLRSSTQLLRRDGLRAFLIGDDLAAGLSNRLSSAWKSTPQFLMVPMMIRCKSRQSIDFQALA
jgi:hypothetical protein